MITDFFTAGVTALQKRSVTVVSPSQFLGSNELVPRPAVARLFWRLPTRCCAEHAPLGPPSQEKGRARGGGLGPPGNVGHVVALRCAPAWDLARRQLAPARGQKTVRDGGSRSGAAP